MKRLNNDQKFLSQLTTLILLSVEGMITEEQFNQLNHILTKNPAARDYYYDFISSYISIKSLEMFAESDDCRPEYLYRCWVELAKFQMCFPTVDVPEPYEVSPTQVKAKGTTRISKMSIASLVTSMAALLFMILFIYLAPSKSGVLVGRCVEFADAKGSSTNGELLPGAGVYAGSITLDEGLAELELNGGTNVIVEAPAEFVVKSPSRIDLNRGRIVVKVSETAEEPFVVVSPSGSVVDYGTEFGVQVDPGNGGTLAYVYEGKVELRSGSDSKGNKSRLPLVMGQGGGVNFSGTLSRKSGLKENFVRRDEFRANVQALHGSAYHKWLSYSYKLRRDPSLVAYYTFQRDNNDPTLLPNMAPGTSSILDGKLYSSDDTNLPTWVEGRWPQTTALAFERKYNQYVEVPSSPASGINGPITIAAWIACPDEKDGGHIVSNRVGVRAQSNYQFGYRSPSMSNWRHAMHLSRKSAPKDSGNQLYSKNLPDHSGWTLIAVTHDNEVIKFYMNGKLVDSKPWSYKQDLAQGGLMIGSDFSPDDPSRFNGKNG